MKFYIIRVSAFLFLISILIWMYLHEEKLVYQKLSLEKSRSSKEIKTNERKENIVPIPKVLILTQGRSGSSFLGSIMSGKY